MSEAPDYALKDLKRRPFQSGVMLLSMTTVVAFTVFLFLFANTLLYVTAYVTSAAFMGSLYVFLETFIWGTLLFVLLLGLVVFSAVISLEMVSRRKDIGLMKAIGTLTDTVFDHFMGQAVILLVTSAVLGASIGVVMYFAGTLWLSSLVPPVRFEMAFPFLQILVLVGLYLLSGYFAAQKPIYDAVQESPISVLNPQLGTRVRHVGLLDSFGLSFRVATKAMGRRLRGSRRTLLSLFMSIALASALWVGGGIVNTTMDSYIVRSMGSNVVAIGHSSVLSAYYQSYSLGEAPPTVNTSLTESSLMVPTDLVGEVASVDGVRAVEQRLIAYSDVSEGPAIVWNPTLQQWEEIGDNRNGTALLIGVDWDSTISDWYFEGEPINASNQVLIGGEMADSMFEDPLVQTLRVRGASFEIRGIAFDVAHGGMVALMPVSAMQDLWGISGANLVLVQLEEYRQDVISQITSIARSHGLDIFLQEEVVRHNLAVVGGLWLLLQPLPVMALISAFFALTNYLLVSVFSRFRDYIIMRSIGAKPLFIAKTIAAEGILMASKAGIPAIVGSILFGAYLLVPEATVPSVLYLPLSFILMFGALLMVSVLAAIPVYMIFSRRMEFRVSEFGV